MAEGCAENLSLFSVKEAFPLLTLNMDAVSILLTLLMLLLLLLLDPVAAVADVETPFALVDDKWAAFLLGDFGASFADVVALSEDPSGVGVRVTDVSGLVAVLVALLLGDGFAAESAPAAAGVESDVAGCCADDAPPFLDFVSCVPNPGINTAVSVSFLDAAAAAVFRDLVGDFGAAAVVVDVAGVLLLVVDAAVSFSVVLSLVFLARLGRFFGLGDSATGVSVACADSTAAISYHKEKRIKNKV